MHAAFYGLDATKMFDLLDILRLMHGTMEQQGEQRERLAFSISDLQNSTPLLQLMDNWRKGGIK